MKDKHIPHKTRYIAFVAASIDGRISLTDHTLPTWTSPEDKKFFQTSLSKMDAVVVGRNTYLSAASRLRKRTTFVLSHRVKTIRHRGTVTFVNPAHVNLAQLFEPYNSVAILGGGMVYQYMLENGFLDEIFVTVEPLIFGRGKEMCSGGSRTTALHLLSVRRLNPGGTLLLHYQTKAIP